ncbi:MAG: thioredoxin family protein [Anaerohalosphaeraceae bacterium]
MKQKNSVWLVIAAALALLLAVQFIQTRRYQTQTENFPDDSIVGQGRPVLVQITSASCIYCRRMMPTLTELARTHAPHFAIALVSLDRQPQAGRKYEVQALPMQIFYDAQGNELSRHVGAMSREEILNQWRQAGLAIP